MVVGKGSSIILKIGPSVLMNQFLWIVKFTTSFQVCVFFFPLPFRWNRMRRVFLSWIFFFPLGQLVSYKTPAGKPMLNQFLLRTCLVKKTEYARIFQNGSFLLSPPGNGRGFYSDIYCGKQGDVLKVNHKVMPPRTWFPWSF